MRILVVDDHPDSANSLASLLSLMGYDARPATSGAEALHLAMEFLPEVAIIDIVMPGMDGHSVARGLRSVSELRDTLLIAVTGTQTGSQRRYPEGEFDLFLLKPVPIDDILSAVRTFR